MQIKKVAVIGAGVMGSGIAAQLANAGVEVELLSRVDAKNFPNDRDGEAKSALDKMVNAKGNIQPLMHKKNAKLIRPGNTEDHMDRLKDCDLIIEVVFEDIKVKRESFAKIDAHRKPGSIVASNTSTIPLSILADGQSEQFKKDFIITHFFNPPRYMPLLELITSKDNPKELVETVTRFMDEKMGKTVVPCNDTPGFIANRIGTFWLECAINEAYARGLPVEKVDALLGKPIGAPKSGVFDLIDVVGLDIMPKVSKSLNANLPETDAYRKISGKFPDLTAMLDKLMADGFTGRKGKGGFYRIKPGSETKEKEALDLKTGKYRDSKKAKDIAALGASKKGGMRALFDHDSPEGQYAWSVMKQTLSYTASLVPQIAGNVAAVDDAMKAGYGWAKGPFEMIDKIGVDWFIKKLEKDGDAVPELLRKAQGKSFYKVENGKLQAMQGDGTHADVTRPEGVLLLSDIKRASKPVYKKEMSIPGAKLGAKLWDIGDGVLCLEFTSTGNTFDPLTFKVIDKACDLIGDGKGKYKALVIHNEGEHFSMGANIGLASLAANVKQHWLVDQLVVKGQDTYKKLKYAPFPVVSAPANMALGGGCEVLLHSARVVAHAELYMGLVEVGVGLIPAWGGCAEMLGRASENKKLPKGPMPAVATVFETLSTPKVSKSAQEAKDLMFLRDSDVIVMNKARLLGEAKKQALEMAKDYTPPKPRTDIVLPGPSGAEALRLAVDGFYQKGAITPYDVVVADKLASVLTGGKTDPVRKVTEDDIRQLEREKFGELVRDARTINRVKMTLAKKGRPEVEKVERKVKGKSTRQLRDEGSKWDVLTKGVTKLSGTSAKSSFNIAKLKDVVIDDRKVKPQMNWPKIGKKK